MLAMNDPGDSTRSIPSTDDGLEAEPPERLSLSVVEETGDWGPLAPVERAIDQVATALARHPRTQTVRGAAEATIVLADDALVRQLNKTYRGKDNPTNVLSFPFHAPPGSQSPRLLGDVILAAETLRREADEGRIPPVHHLQHLVLHGLLHLIGFDHETDAEAEDMERLETEILAGIGVADPHAAMATM
jgi:probable rRNA maturation factor